jgi:small-conductance mechanosensitive channel
MHSVAYLVYLAVISQHSERWLAIKEWLISHGLKILFTIAGYLILISFIKYLTRKFVRMAEDEDRTTRSEREKRADTISGIINASARVFFAIIALFMILREFGINITPLLTGAGVAGVAIGFGAQSLIRDFLHGFFILAEDQFRVGDVVKIDDHAGLVERISMRVTRLRSLDGSVHIVPNGQIKIVENKTHGWSRAVVDVDVAYDEDLDRVMEVIEEEAEKLRSEKKYSKQIIGKAEALGVEDLGDSGITIRLLAKTKPLKQWEIMRHLRKRLKMRFDQEGISIPFPQLRLHGEIIGTQS